MILPPRGAGHGSCPPRGGGRVISPALGPMAVQCPLVILAGRHQGQRQRVRVKLERRQEVVRPGQGTEGRSPPRVTQDRCHAGQVTPNLGLQPCLFVFQEGTTHKQCVSGTKGSGRGGARPNPGFLIAGQGSGDPQLGCRVSSGQLSQQLGDGGGRRSQ